jgi:hypothetical protein
MRSIAGRRFAAFAFIVIVVFTSLVAGTAVAAAASSPQLQAQGGWTNYGTYPTQAACAAAARTNAQGHSWKCVPAQGAFTLLVLV